MVNAMIIEENTEYANSFRSNMRDVITLEYRPNFEKICLIAKNRFLNFPKDKQEELFFSLDRGVEVISNEDQLFSYLYSYGKMHETKMQHAIDFLPDDFLLQKEIDIIDYGCGQAIGTICYKDYLSDIRCHKQNKQRIGHITLIEPSEISLKRAALHTSMLIPGAKVTTIKKRFEDLVNEDIVCNPTIPTLHILSNVIDLPCFDIKHIAALLNDCLRGVNLFLCVSPDVRQSEEKMRQFTALLGGEICYCQTLDKHELDSDHEWTCTICNFIVINDAVSKTEEDTGNISTQIAEIDQYPSRRNKTDQFGVVFNRNKTRLLYHDPFIHHPKNYSIPEGTKVICDYALQCTCEDLDYFNSIEIPDSVTHIGDYAFENCEIGQANIPKNVIHIGKNPFRDTEGPFNRTRVYSIKSESCRFTANEGFLIDSYESRLITFFGSQSIVRIPNTVKTIGESAFSYRYDMVEVLIPESVERIEEKAFYGSGRLQNIAIPDSVLFIGESAFEKCSSLKQIVLPSNLSKLNNNTFKNCTSLTSISIPNTVSIIGNSVFEECKSLKNIVLPNELIEIGCCAFKKCESLTRVNLPSNVSIIKESAFSECLFLKYIKLPDFINSIGSNSFNGLTLFDGCYNLDKIFIPKGSYEKCKKLLDEELWDRIAEL